MFKIEGERCSDTLELPFNIKDGLKIKLSSLECTCGYYRFNWENHNRKYKKIESRCMRERERELIY